MKPGGRERRKSEKEKWRKGERGKREENFYISDSLLKRKREQAAL